MIQTSPFLVATRSAHKLEEIRAILAGCAQVISLEDASVAQSPDEDDIECFDTFHDNAIAKALYFMRLTGLPTIADDSGIVVDALDGRPGVWSRRYAQRVDPARAGTLNGVALDLANNARIAHELRDVPADARTAHYMCVAALALPDGTTCSALGSCSGVFVLEPRGDAGFGYDPHFLLPPEGLTFGQIHVHEKQRISHRARAFRALAPLLG